MSAAEDALRRYLVEKHDPAAAAKIQSDDPLIADILAFYLDQRAEEQARPAEVRNRVARLLGWWKTKRCSEVRPSTCRDYAIERGNGAARRELEDLRAALRLAWKERILPNPIPVTLPPPGAARERWLTRSEVARLLWAAWRLREKQKRGRGHNGGPALETERYTARHVARFILIGLYTGTRAGAVCAAAIRPTVGHAYVDVERGLFYRRANGVRETKKRTPPVGLDSRLLAHLRRWEAKGLSKSFVVEWNGKPVERVHKAFRAVRDAAGLGPDVTPHILRHTAATWGMQNGAEPYALAGMLGMSLEILLEVYGHHHPTHNRAAAAAVAMRPKRERRTETDRNDGTEQERSLPKAQ
ncbi:site-specific integrase [Bosea lathyri]|nr:site-specific integrase [Bosea lathyri]